MSLPAPANVIVDAMPRRMAHALHALLEATAAGASPNGNGPPTAQEIVLYDTEAFSARQTGAALREAAKRHWCWYAPPGMGAPGCWWLANETYELRSALEERYLDDTDESTLCTFCDQRKPNHEFHDGARCDACVQEQDGDG